MLPGLDPIPTESVQSSTLVNKSNDTMDTPTQNDNVTYHVTGPSEEQLAQIRKLQTERGLKRRYIGSIGNQLDLQNYDEKMIKNLTPKTGHAKIQPEITKIRYILDQYKRQKPTIELHHSFDFTRAFWEFIYNYFHILSFPILIYKEGMAGFWAREMLSIPPLIAWITFMTTNIAFCLANEITRQCFWFPFFVNNLFTICRVLVIATKYGYLPKNTFNEYSNEDRKVTNDYLQSIHLVPGWLKQHPLTMAREFYFTEQRLGIDFSKLRMNFRDTKAFNLMNSKNCACSGYATKLDWFLPYIYTNINSEGGGITNRFFLFVFLFFLLLSYTTVARLLPYSLSAASFDNCDLMCWILIGCIPFSLGWSLWAGFLWAFSMALDFNRRYSRMKLCTHLLDPKRETFIGTKMRRSYKAQLFGSVNDKLKAKILKQLDLQTIDLYSSETLFSWAQFRHVLYDCGIGFLQREEAYNGFLIICTLLTLFFFLYSLVTDTIVVVWEDLIITLLLCVFILAPAMWTLSCGNSLNYQTTKQQKILSERVVEMLHFQFMAEQKKMPRWAKEIKIAREMCESVIDVLSQDEYSVKLIGIKVDNSVFQLTATVIGILLYISGFLVYNNWIME
eukprot:555445_1